MRVALAFAAMVFVSTGIRFIVGPFLKPMVADLGLDRASFSLVISLSLFLYGVLQPFVGRAVDRVGARALLAAGTLLLGLLAGHTWLRTGDLVLWLNGEGAPIIRFALDERAPRVAAALAAGAALAISGAFVQASCRNPLAEPGLLGITGGAGLGAVVVVTTGSGGMTPLLVGAAGGALLAFAAAGALSWIARWHDPAGPLSVEHIARETIGLFVNGIGAPSRPDTKTAE